MVLRRRRPFLQVGCRLWSLVVLGLTVGNVLLGLKLLQVWDCEMPTAPRGVPPRFKSTPPQILAQLQTDPNLARWDSQRLFRLLDHFWVGPSFLRLSRSFTVCLATQSSLEKLSSIVQVARNWAGPISAALYAAGDDEYRLLRGYIQYLWRCHPEVKEKVSFHLAFPWDKLPTDPSSPPTQVNGGCGKADSVLTELLKSRSLETLRWRLRNPYPQNHLRNLARKNCQSQQVFLTDVDIIPSMGLAEGLEEFFKGGRACKTMCAYVIPTYELDERAPFPSNKSHLIRLTTQGLARPFHQKVFIYNQYATNFTRWERDTQNDVHVSHPVTNFEFLYEPFYVASDLVPVHDERFLGYGFTRNTQVYEMFVAGYQFYVLSPVFTVHWGLQNRKGRPSWRERQNSNNRKNLDQFKREVFARYHKDPLNMILHKTKNRHAPKLT